MHRPDFSNWLTVASHLAVLIGLVLIYIEIQQNTLVTRAALVDSGYSQIAELYRSFGEGEMATITIKAMGSPAELSAEERVKYNERLERLLILYGRERFFVQLGIFEEWHGIVNTTAGTFLSNEYGRAYWQVRRAGYNPEITAVVDARLEQLNGRNLYLEFDQAVVDMLAQPNGM